LHRLVACRSSAHGMTHIVQKTKNAQSCKRAFSKLRKQNATQSKLKLQRANFGCLRAFGAVIDFNFYFLAFVQAAIAAALDSREMCEHVRAASVRSNKAETFIGVEPFDFALLSHDV